MIDPLERTRGYFKVRVDTSDTDAYRWKFGVEGLTGKGAVLSFSSESHSGSYDICSVELIDYQGKSIGVEDGFGYETTIAAALNIPHPLGATSLKLHMPNCISGRGAKLGDSLLASLAMCAARVVPGKQGGAPGTILQRYLKAVSFLAREEGVGIQELSAASRNIARDELGNEAAAAELVNHLVRARTREDIFVRAVEDAIGDDWRAFRTLRGVEVSVRNTGVVDVLALAEFYSFSEFRASRLYCALSPFLRNESALLLPPPGAPRSLGRGAANC